jgi:large subunit ribosomal protein L3
MIGYAKKIGMTRLFVDGKSIPVTALEFDTQVVLQRKTEEKDGYVAVQVAARPRKHGTQARKGHAKKYTDQEQDYVHMSEFRDVVLDEAKKEITIEDFQESDVLKISGLTIGRGFAGPIKKYGFRGQPASHGHDHERAVGSIGQRYPQRTIKGKRMAGQMGNQQNTIAKVSVIAIDQPNKLIFVKGSLPGANSSYLKIKKIA